MVAKRRTPVPAPAIRPEEPACLRKQILPALGLREDLPVHFIDRKRVTDTDLNPQQNRFRILSEGALGRLRSILTVDELDSANMLKDSVSKSTQQPEDDDAAADKEGEQEQRRKKRKRRGKVHGGLPVRLVDIAAGASGELLMSRWTSSRGTIVKGGGYINYIRRCSFKEDNVVDIWAFKQRAFRLFGKTVFDESLLHVFVVKT